MGRDRPSGQGRSRPHHSQDAQPLPDTIRLEALEAVTLLSILDYAYRREHGYGWPPGGAGLGVMAGQSNATETAFLAPEQAASRERCRAAQGHVRAALESLRAAATMLTEGEVTQPAERSADSVIEHHEFETAKARREHRRRERELNA